MASDWRLAEGTPLPHPRIHATVEWRTQLIIDVVMSKTVPNGPPPGAQVSYSVVSSEIDPAAIGKTGDEHGVVLVLAAWAGS